MIITPNKLNYNNSLPFPNLYEATILPGCFPFPHHLGHGRQVDRHAHQPVAEQAPHEGRGEGQGRLGRRQRHGGAAVGHGAGEDG